MSTHRTPAPDQHGTLTGYSYGCRCDPCRDAKAASRNPNPTPRAYADPLTIAAMHGSGATAQQVADRLGIKPCTVRQAAREMGLPPFRDPRLTDDSTSANVRAMRDAGASLRAIASNVGMSVTGVRKVLGRTA